MQVLWKKRRGSGMTNEEAQANCFNEIKSHLDKLTWVLDKLNYLNPDGIKAVNLAHCQYEKAFKNMEVLAKND